MHKDYEKLFTHLKPPEPSADLFGRIILAIRQEQELQHTKRLVFSFLALTAISLVAIPFSWTMLSTQIENSGILYFLSTLTTDLGMTLAVWQDAGLAILESLPLMGITVFVLNTILLLFTIRLFLYKKRLLLGYLLHP